MKCWKQHCEGTEHLARAKFCHDMKHTASGQKVRPRVISGSSHCSTAHLDIAWCTRDPGKQSLGGAFTGRASP